MAAPKSAKRFATRCTTWPCCTRKICPSRLVTVSVGAATGLPSQTTTDCSALVAAADRALYAAKDSGRDRLVRSGQVVPWPAKSA